MESGGALYLYGFDHDENLVFRSSNNPSRLQREPVTVREGKAWLNCYWFKSEYLNRLPQEPIDV